MCCVDRLSPPARSCLISRAEATGSYGSTKPDRHIPHPSGSGAQIIPAACLGDMGFNKLGRMSLF